MAPVRTDHGAKLIQGDCLEQLKSLPDCSVDSLVTDPPAGISFMGKDWDCDKGGRKQWIAWMTSIMEECMRVLKPGAHGLVWALPRTSHWTATALEDAGFEVRDVVTHLFGTGFPKSLDVSKAIDKAAGAEREHLGFKKSPDGRDYSKEDSAKAGLSAGTSFAVGQSLSKLTVTAPATDAAKKWQGWGTALKPASEHWILVRKPLSEKTVAKNVLKWGTGALNIDASRIEAGADHAANCNRTNVSGAWGQAKGATVVASTQGRFPANLVLSGDAPEMLDAQSGVSKSPSGPVTQGKRRKGSGYERACNDTHDGKGIGFGDSGGASRFFFYSAS